MSEAEKATVAKQLALESAAAYLRDHPTLFYVKGDDRYFEFVVPLNRWMNFSDTAIQRGDARVRGGFKIEALRVLLESGGHIKDERAFSFTDTPPTILNEFRRDNWLEPLEGTTENTRFFDYLIDTLGDHRAENVKHFKQVIGWKYLHPEDAMLPCLCFYGQGGAGKNLFVDVVAPVIFGNGSTASVMFSAAEKFNSDLAGKLIVNFNESVNGGIKLDILKNIVGSPFLRIERKGVDAIRTVNTALYTVSTNNSDGAFKIERNGASRRWSIMKLTTTLLETICNAEGMTEDDARLFLAEYLLPEVYTRPAEVAHFLWSCVAEARRLRTAPAALHGADYEELMEAQAGPEEDVLREVFIDDPNFQYITFGTLYELYRDRVEEANPSGRGKALKNLAASTDEFLRHHGLDVERTAKQKRIGGRLHRLFYRRSLLQLDAAGHWNLADNSDYYRSNKHLDAAALAADPRPSGEPAKRSGQLLAVIK